jgi:nucleotide-binding universal stress UspA family protein
MSCFTVSWRFARLDPSDATVKETQYERKRWPRLRRGPVVEGTCPELERWVYECRNRDKSGVISEREPAFAAPYGQRDDMRRRGKAMFQAIVVGTDGSATATEAVRRAGVLAAAFGADLHVVNAYGAPATLLACSAEPSVLPIAVSEWETAARDHARLLLDAVANELTGVDTVTTHAVPAQPATALLAVAEEVHADLIVVGNRGMQGARRVLGSVPNHVSHHAHCDVLVVDTVGALV